MKLKLLVISILAMYFFGCKNEAQKSVSKTIESKEISLLDTLKLRLDNGKKWVVNDATQVGIIKMDSIINSFKSNKDEDFASLGNNLSKQTSFIIKNCDMTGEAHDQLHIVLVPILDEITILKESNNKQENKKALNNLEELIDDYFNHFQS